MQERLHEINSLRSDLRGQRGRLSHAPGTRCLFPVDLRSGFPEISPLPARSRGKFQPAPRKGSSHMDTRQRQSMSLRFLIPVPVQQGYLTFFNTRSFLSRSNHLSFKVILVIVPIVILIFNDSRSGWCVIIEMKSSKKPGSRNAVPTMAFPPIRVF